MDSSTKATAVGQIEKLIDVLKDSEVDQILRAGRKSFESGDKNEGIAAVANAQKFFDAVKTQIESIIALIRSGEIGAEKTENCLTASLLKIKGYLLESASTTDLKKEWKDTEKWVKRLNIEGSLAFVNGFLSDGKFDLSIGVLSGVIKSIDGVLSSLARIASLISNARDPYAAMHEPIKTASTKKSKVSLPVSDSKSGIVYLAFGKCGNTSNVKEIARVLSDIGVKVLDSDVGEIDIEDTCWFEVRVDNIGSFARHLDKKGIADQIEFWQWIKEGQGTFLSRIRHKRTDVDEYAIEKQTEYAKKRKF